MTQDNDRTHLLSAREDDSLTPIRTPNVQGQGLEMATFTPMQGQNSEFVSVSQGQELGIPAPVKNQGQGSGQESVNLSSQGQVQDQSFGNPKLNSQEQGQVFRTSALRFQGLDQKYVQNQIPNQLSGSTLALRSNSTPSFHSRCSSGPPSNSTVVQRSVTIDHSMSLPSKFKRIHSDGSIGQQQSKWELDDRFRRKSYTNNSLETIYSKPFRRKSSSKKLSGMGKWWSRNGWTTIFVCLVVLFFLGPWILNEWMELLLASPNKPNTGCGSAKIIIDGDLASIYICFNESSPLQVLSASPSEHKNEDAFMQSAPATAEMLQPGLRYPLQQILNQSIWQNISYGFTKSVLPEKYFPKEIRTFHTSLLKLNRSEAGSSGVAVAMDKDSKEFKQMMQLVGGKGKDHSPLIVQNPNKSQSGKSLGSSCPQSNEVSLFMAITTRCCTGAAQIRRDAIRNTWLKTAQELYGDQVTIRFVIAQPPLEDTGKAYNLLSDEVRAYGDIIFVPGLDTYRNLPNKTLRLLQYALSSPCGFTHVMKTDDDVYMRMSNLMDLLKEPGNNANLFTGNLAGIDRPPNQHGFWPVRNPASKWYVSQEELPGEISPSGVSYAEGWGYILSRDAAMHVMQEVNKVTQDLVPKWPWWDRLPWEDVMIGAILQNFTVVQHNSGFKSAWGVCSQDTIVKHLDIDSPGLLQDLYEQEQSGIWDISPVPCSTGDFQLGSMDSWRAWRNKNLPVGQLFLD